MAKYTELFAEYLESGGTLPPVFSSIDGFGDLFTYRYADHEIGFETEALFAMKLEERANIIIPQYVKRIAATDAAWLVINNPDRTETKIYDFGLRQTDNTLLPMSPLATAEPNQRTRELSRTDTETTTYAGLTPDEAIRRAEYFQRLDGTAWILIDACLAEFKKLFMQVY